MFTAARLAFRQQRDLLAGLHFAQLEYFGESGQPALLDLIVQHREFPFTRARRQNFRMEVQVARRGRDKGRQCQAARLDRRQPRKLFHIDAAATRHRKLRHQTHVGDTRLVTHAVARAALGRRQPQLERIQPFHQPVIEPATARGHVEAAGVTQITHHAQAGQRLHIACHQQGELPGTRTLDRRGGQQRRLGMGLVQVFDDRE